MSVPFTIHESASDGRVTLALAGEVDLATVPAIRERVAALIADGTTDIVIDLAEVTFLDSSGIGALIACQRLVTRAGGTYRVTNPQGRVAAVLDLTGVMPLLTGTPEPL